MAMTTSLANAETARRGIFSALQLIETFRELQHDMPMQTVSVFFVIAMRPGLYQRELLNLLDLSQPSISRNVMALGETNRHGEPGLGLIEQRRDPLDARQFTLHLTPAGKELVNRVLSIIACAG
ncbi:MarR family winged helix-turn-helix transcriptional regulator [Ensifer sp. ENS03]|uniref:MarR family winged helix-turn-helix transcriptional regulator n=1 Tax=Ensifer sp. ENS03 TaxID=2769283 RepID=UPI001785F1CC|nr:MarR family winged helix-turn-helix transcriptional regulator [Ensifer sp. ENS03]MBD9558448.1 winged helix-turn-helix transcriptional regulator [Ensifer sp. ENS03]